MAPEYPQYVCKLDAATQKKALDELYEDPKNRQGAIDTFRQWILQQKHMKCPMDDVFLLGFLRGKHFSQLEARNSLEFYMRQREKIPNWMKNIDTASKRLLDFVDLGAILWLDRDQENRRIVWFTPGEVNCGSDKIRETNFIMFAAVLYYMFLGDEMTQVHGTQYICDFSSQTMANDMKMPFNEKQKAITMMQKTFPARVKGIHMFNCGALLDFLFKWVTSLLNDKLKQRFHTHAHGLENVYKAVPMEILPREYLPDDYKGKCAGTIKEIQEKMKVTLCSAEMRHRIKHLSSEEFFIKMEDKDTDVPVASFRKLNVD